LTSTPERHRKAGNAQRFPDWKASASTADEKEEKLFFLFTRPKNIFFFNENEDSTGLLARRPLIWFGKMKISAATTMWRADGAGGKTKRPAIRTSARDRACRNTKHGFLWRNKRCAWSSVSLRIVPRPRAGKILTDSKIRCPSYSELTLFPPCPSWRTRLKSHCRGDIDPLIENAPNGKTLLEAL